MFLNFFFIKQRSSNGLDSKQLKTLSASLSKFNCLKTLNLFFG